MAAISTIVAVAGLAVAAGGAYMSYRQQREAARNQRRAQEEQRKMNAIQEARQAQEAARERRAQIREERVRRARILQASSNLGVGESSGELGATGALATNLGSGIGHNVGVLDMASRMSAHSQRQADFLSAAAQNQARSSMWGQASSFGSQIFNQAGGFNSIFSGQDVQDVSGKVHQGVRWGRSYSL